MRPASTLKTFGATRGLVRALGVFSMVGALVLGGASAQAETPAPRGPQVIELEAMVIEGKIAKPQVFYVLGRSRVQYENLKMNRVFVDRIVEGAKKNPF